MYLQVSFIGSVIVIPPSLIMDKIFRMSRPRIKGDQLREIAEKMLEANQKANKEVKKKRTLPWWSKFFAWQELTDC